MKIVVKQIEHLAFVNIDAKEGNNYLTITTKLFQTIRYQYDNWL